MISVWKLSPEVRQTVSLPWPRQFNPLARKRHAPSPRQTNSLPYIRCSQ